MAKSKKIEANIFRNVKTKRLVQLFIVTPATVLGQYIQEEDLRTKEIKLVTQGVSVKRDGSDFVIDKNFYKKVSYN